MTHWPKHGSILIFLYVLTFSTTHVSRAAAVAKEFPAEVQTIHIPSSLDGSEQPTLFYFPKNRTHDEPVPLLIGLHTWSGDHQQQASIPMAQWCIEQNWAFLHPNFRGPNWTPNACGSDLAVQDVMDAIDHVRNRFTIDQKRLYLMGTSGGGHMTLLLAGRYPSLFAGASAWVPISDLSAWFYECQLSGQRYAEDLLKALGGPPHASENVRLAYRHRSPLTWLSRAQSVPVDISAGVRDGHEGSVPISHSFNAFNQLAAAEDRLSELEILEFTGKSQVPAALASNSLSDPSYGLKRPLFRRQSKNARLTIFDGGHEGIPTAGLTWLAKQIKP